MLLFLITGRSEPQNRWRDEVHKLKWSLWKFISPCTPKTAPRCLVAGCQRAQPTQNRSPRLLVQTSRCHVLCREKKKLELESCAETTFNCIISNRKLSHKPNLHEKLCYQPPSLLPLPNPSSPPLQITRTPSFVFWDIPEHCGCFYFCLSLVLHPGMAISPCKGYLCLKPSSPRTES